MRTLVQRLLSFVKLQQLFNTAAILDGSLTILHRGERYTSFVPSDGFGLSRRRRLCFLGANYYY